MSRLLSVVSFGECNNRIYISNETAMVVRAQSHGTLPIFCYQQNQRSEAKVIGGREIIGVISAKTKQIDMRTAENKAHPLDGNDDKEPHAVCYSVDALSSNSMKSKNPHSGFHKTTVSKCLDTMCCDPSCNQGGVVVCYERTNGED